MSYTYYNGFLTECRETTAVSGKNHYGGQGGADRDSTEKNKNRPGKTGAVD